MARIVLLDAGPLGRLALSDRYGPGSECRRWLLTLVSSGADVRAPWIAQYEVRRELLRLGATAKLDRLDASLRGIREAPVTRDAWQFAAGFWAISRNAGLPTAPASSLDGDAILAGVAASIATGGHDVVIATDNPRHLGRFHNIIAREWRTIV